MPIVNTTYVECGACKKRVRSDRPPPSWVVVTYRQEMEVFCSRQCQQDAALGVRRRLEHTFTDTEIRLLELLAEGLQFREIGRRLHLARSTLKNRSTALYHSLGASSSAEAIMVAHALRLIDLDVIALRVARRLARPPRTARKRDLWRNAA